MKVCFVVVNLEHYKFFFSDRSENESLVVLGKEFTAVKILENKFKKAHTWIYRIVHALISRQVNLNDIDVLVITDLAQIRFPKGYIKWVKSKYPKIKTIMMFYNKVAALYGIDSNVSLESLPDKDVMFPFDRIFTYDPEESERFGFEYYTVISNVSKYIPEKTKQIKSDVFYCGSIKHEWRKERFEEVDRVYRYLTSNNVVCDFHLVFSNNSHLPLCQYATTTRLPYLETVQRTIESRAILEIVSDGQMGVTERFFNALMYNKRLITNNTSVLDHPYYNPKYMKVFDTPDEIDISWLLSDDIVEYNYDGKYTPKGMLKLLSEGV